MERFWHYHIELYFSPQEVVNIVNRTNEYLKLIIAVEMPSFDFDRR